jgi:hypothetical protein
LSNSSSSQAFCLFLDSDTATDLPTATTGQGLRYFELSGCERFISQGGKLSCPRNGDHPIRLDLLRNKTQRSLLMRVEPGVRVTTNGLPAACFTVLNPGDVLGVDEHVMYLSLLNRPYIGPPNKSHLAARCGYCRVPIQDAADMRVYDCPRCNLPTHYHGEEIPIEKRLECAKLSSHCGHCQAEIVESEGFSHVPVV